MLIGNNNPLNNKNNFYNNSLKEKNNFETRFNRLKNDTKNNNKFVEDIYNQVHSDPTSAKDMKSKSLAMLQERLDKGLISLEEFNKKCTQLRK